MTCPTPAANADTLPFAVDSKYIASGYEGDAVGLAPNPGAISMPTTMGDPSCGGMPRGGMGRGTCHTVIYSPLAAGTPIGYPVGATAMGWAGVAWQYPLNNWGGSVGYAIPAGATKLAFYAKGAVGGETVSFWAGVVAPGGTAVCSDPFMSGTNPQTKITLTNTWAQYTMPIIGTYATGVITGFGYSLANQVPTGDGGVEDAGAVDAAAKDGGDAGSAFPPVTFYVDDLVWQ
jgi:hypothetical protein